MKAGLLTLILSFLVGLSATALPLAMDHFLYPRDQEILWVSGIEQAIPRRKISQFRQECREGRASSQAEPTCFYLSFFEEVSTSLLHGSFERTQADFLFFGEVHIHSEIAYEMAALLPELRASGYTTLALEMFNESSQPDLDRYLEGTISLDEMVQILSEQWSYQNSGYAELLRVAKEQGFHIVALDHREEIDHPHMSSELELRDEAMVEVILRRKWRFPEEKWIVYSGKLHAYKTQSVQRRVLTIAERIQQSLPDFSIESYMFARARTHYSTTHDILLAEGAPTEPSLYRLTSPYLDGFIILPNSRR